MPKGITAHQQRAIDALLDTHNIAESAQRVGIQEKELMQWLTRDSAFNEVLSQVANNRRDEAFQEVMAELEWEWSK